MLVKRVSRKAWLAATVASSVLAVASQAVAQGVSVESAQSSSPPAIFPAIDPNGVDLTTGHFTYAAQQVSVGDLADGGLAKSFFGNDARDNNVGAISTVPTGDAADTVYYVVTVGESAVEFSPNQDGTFSSTASSQGQTLTQSGNIYTYVALDGSTYVFSADLTTVAPYAAGKAQVTSVTKPNGEVLTYSYLNCGQGCNVVETVSSNRGYLLKYEYTGTIASVRISKVTAINRAYEACDPMTGACSTNNTAWGSVSYAWSPDGTTLTTTDATDIAGTQTRTTTYTFNSSGDITKVVTPQGKTVNIAYADPDDPTHVTSISTQAGSWTYRYSSAPDPRAPSGPSAFEITVLDPVGRQWNFISDPLTRQILSVQDGAGNVTTYDYDVGDRLSQIHFPEQDWLEYQYSAQNGQIEYIIRHPKSGTGSRTTHFTYDPNCANTKTCNKPIAIDDAGAHTDIAYDSTTGEVSTLTLPAGNNGERPQVRYRYDPRYASFLNASNIMTQAPGPVYRLGQVSQCLGGDQAACVGGVNEARTVFDYGSATPNNLQLASITNTDGPGSGPTATTAYSYNVFGDIKTVDGPLAGPGDTVRYRYDRARQLVGFVGAASVTGSDFAIRYDRSPDGLVSDVTLGNVADQTDNAWINFTPQESLVFDYDAEDRLVRSSLSTYPSGSSGGPVMQEATEYSYNGDNSPKCTAVRMTAASLTAQPGDACVSGSNDAGNPDRIVQQIYDNDDRPFQVLEGVGTGDARTVEQLRYTPNGKLNDLTDGNGNMTTFVYDVFDRLSEVEYPLPTIGSRQSSSSDTVQFHYNDTTWDVTSVTLRDGETLTNTYDNRHNVITRSLPLATTYTYDNLNQPTQVSAGGAFVNATYDVLGRQLTEGQPLGTVKSEYDPAGRRTKVTLPDNSFTTYDYDNTGAPLHIYDGSGATLVTYGYDTQSRLDSIVRANGVTTTYGYDGLSRLNALSQSFAGASNPSNVTETYGYNLANQITTRTFSNSAYRWRGAKNSANYVLNGLNEVVSANNVPFSNGAMGNLRSDGSQSYTYDQANRLTGAGNSSFSWDPADRMTSAVENGATTQFLYDGPEVVAEYSSSGSELRHYVRGPAIDQPLVVYEGAARNWLLSDERGSIMAASNDSGASTATNTYDEYGIPDPGNVGRFQYTGQMWLLTGQPGQVGSGLYNYKARAYSPYLGRFLQTDPIGFASGPNLYAYASADPINGSDPLGLDDDLPQPPPRATPVSSVTVTPIPLISGGGVTFATPSGASTDFPHVHQIDGLNVSDTLIVSPNRTSGSRARVELPPELPPKDTLHCTSEFATKHSLASTLHLIPGLRSGVGGFVADAVGGNTLSALVDLHDQIVSGQGGGHGAVYNGMQAAVAGPTLGFSPVVAAVAPKTAKVLQGPIDVIEGQAVGDVLASGLGQAKLFLDVATFGIGYLHCIQQQ